MELSPGLWLSGPLELKSNVTLNVQHGATLKATNKDKEFTYAFIKSEPQPGEAFILVRNAVNANISGSGTIDGSGEEYWWDEAKRLKKDYKSGNDAEFKARYPGVPLTNGQPRPWLVEYSRSADSSISGVTLLNSPMWNLVLRHSHDLKIDGIKVMNPVDSPNSDGIDIVSSQQISIKNTFISTGDDNIAIKSGLAGAPAKPAQNITIEDSVMGMGHGISIGSETANGIQNIKIKNVLFSATENGVRIKSARDRGNDISNIHAENLVMDKVESPILITMSYSGQSGAGSDAFTVPMESQPVTATTPLVHDVSYKNIHARNSKNSIIISGLPESAIKGVVLQNIDMQAENLPQLRYAQGSIKEVKVNQSTELKKGPAVDFD